MESNKLYNKYSDYLIQKYNEKTYKLPINLPITCPNRDGNLGHNGCSFCKDEGAGFESLPSSFSVASQLSLNKNKVLKNHKATKFIAYFQCYSNTYMPIEKFISYVKQACIEEVVEIAISTRPDCINSKYLDELQIIKEQNNVEINIELGLQTANYHTLNKINRGHTLAEFIDAILQIKKYNFSICTHLILNLPQDNMLDVIENAKILSALKIDQVKLHALYILEGTKMGEQYKNKDITIISVEEYKERVIIFLEYLSPEIVIQRLIGRTHREDALFVNWSTSWWKIRDDIEKQMKIQNRYQGKKFDYLNGKALVGLK